MELLNQSNFTIVNLITPGAGDILLGCGHISNYSEYVLSSTLSIYGTLIAIVRDYDVPIPSLDNV